MKANQKYTQMLRKDTRGAVGIGTMIVFIATILVAATAAAVLIDTSGKLQEKSQQTGSETTKEVASNLIIKGIYAKRNTVSSAALDSLNVTVSLAPGAEPVDLSELIMRISDGSAVSEMSYHATDPSATQFITGTAVRDDDSSYSTSSPVMTAGDLVNLKVNLTAASITLNVREDVSLTLVPEVGAQVIGDFSTPQSFARDLIIVLR